MDSNNVFNIFFCYAAADRALAEGIVSDLQSEGISITLELDDIQEDLLEKIIYPKIEDRDVFVFLATENSRADSIATSCVKYANDLNKKVIPIGNHTSGMFSGQSWIKKEMDIRIDEVAYHDLDSRAEFFSLLRAWLGMVVEPGDKVGKLVGVTASSVGSLYRGKQCLCELNPGETSYVRLSKGVQNLYVVGERFGDQLKVDSSISIRSNVGSTSMHVQLAEHEEMFQQQQEERERQRLKELQRKERERIERIQKLQSLLNSQSQQVDVAHSKYVDASIPLVKNEWEPNHLKIWGISALIAFFTGWVSIVFYVIIGYVRSNSKHDNAERARQQAWYDKKKSCEKEYFRAKSRYASTIDELKSLQSIKYLND